MLIMQNKPNFQKSQMNVSIFSQMAYEYKHDWTLGENKPNTNPNKANFKRDLAKMGHHELKYIDSLGQLTLNLIKDRKSN